MWLEILEPLQNVILTSSNISVSKRLRNRQVPFAKEPLSHVFREYQKRRRKLYVIKFITDYNVRLKTESLFTFPVIYVVLLTWSRNYPYQIILHSTINYLPSSKFLSKKSVTSPLIIHSIILSRRNCLKGFAFEGL